VLNNVKPFGFSEKPIRVPQAPVGLVITDCSKVPVNAFQFAYLPSLRVYVNYAIPAIQEGLTLLNWEPIPDRVDFESLVQEGHIRLKKNLRVRFSLDKGNELLVLPINEAQSGVQQQKQFCASPSAIYRQ